MSNPLVSIVCITYNHEPYLRQALDSFLMQKTLFAYEIVLAEDCSSDGTRKICEEYAVKYPDIIHYIWSDNNVGAVENEARAIRAAKGKYIALCEGDDYWTDVKKLQKQVSFMESHPEYSVTFHRYKIHYEDTNVWQEDNAGWLFEGKDIEGVDITIEQTLDKWITQYLTAVFRRDCYNFAWADKYQMQLRTIDVYREMWEKNNDERLRELYIKALQYFLDSFYKESSYKKEMLHVALILLKLNRNVVRFVKNILRII